MPLEELDIKVSLFLEFDGTPSLVEVQQLLTQDQVNRALRRYRCGHVVDCGRGISDIGQNVSQRPLFINSDSHAR